MIYNIQSELMMQLYIVYDVLINSSILQKVSTVGTPEIIIVIVLYWKMQVECQPLKTLIRLQEGRLSITGESICT